MPENRYAELVLLVLEPSSMIRKLISRYCQELGISQLDFMENGSLALAEMPRRQPDVVISALYLEDMSSDELLTRIRSTAALAATPFILLSSETRFDKLDPLRQAGVTAILQKPFTSHEFQLGLEHALQQMNQGEISLDDGADISDLRVLIVDDSTLARRHTRRLLNQMGLERFVEAGNGEEALACLHQQDFDLIVTDLNMPAMDGEQLVRHIRQDNARAIPILMITSEENESRLAAVHQAGVSAICDKPFAGDELRQTLLRMLQI